MRKNILAGVEILVLSVASIFTSAANADRPERKDQRGPRQEQRQENRQQQRPQQQQPNRGGFGGVASGIVNQQRDRQPVRQDRPQENRGGFGGVVSGVINQQQRERERDQSRNNRPQEKPRVDRPREQPRNDNNHNNRPGLGQIIAKPKPIIQQPRDDRRDHDRRDDHNDRRNERPQVRHDGGGRNDRPSHYNRDRSRERQNVIVRERDHRRYEIDRRRDVRNNHRHSWSVQFNINFGSYTNVSVVRNHSHWNTRYSTWYARYPRPVMYRAYYPVVWLYSMPVATSYAWQYADVETVSENLEDLAYKIYRDTDNALYGSSYKNSVMYVMANLVSAAQNYNDVIDEGADWSDSIYDLFYLEAKINEAYSVIANDSSLRREVDEIQQMRYYVNELLWTYRHYCVQ